MQLHSLKVQTSDTLRYNYLISFCIQNRMPIILCGPTGTRKTSVIKDFGEKFALTTDSMFLEIVFSSRTTCTQVSEQI